MTKIRDFARVTPLKKATEKDAMHITQIEKPERVLSQGFISNLEKRKADAKSFRDLVLIALDSLGQPATVTEIQHHISTELNKEFSQPRIRYAVDALINEGLLSFRVETPGERELRFNGLTPLGNPATLYFPSEYGSTVPPRTVAVIVEGLALNGPNTGPRARKAKKVKIKTEPALYLEQKVQMGSAPVPGTTTDAAVEYLLNRLVEERTADLRAELAEAQERLAQMKKLLS
jgi:hypothetical protein